jgi:hypothetical protein
MCIQQIAASTRRRCREHNVKLRSDQAPRADVLLRGPVVASPATSLEILSANPLDHAAEIKGLLLADGHAQFPEFFDRAYPSGVDSGGKSWIGLDRGRLVLHIARWPRRFMLRDRIVSGGVLLSLIAAKSHRTFFPALKLLRQVITDSKSDRAVDFLYSTSNPLATSLLKTAGFSAIGTLKRFTFPLGDARWYADAATRVYRLAVRVRSWPSRACMVEHAPQHVDVGAFVQLANASAALRPVRSSEQYGQCLAGYPSSADHWFTFHRGTDGAPPSAAVFVRGGADGFAILHSVARVPSLPLTAIIPTLTGALRRRGYRRLVVSTIAQTPFARELTRAGFVPRVDRGTVLGCALTEAGADALRSVATWEVTGFDCEPFSP